MKEKSIQWMMIASAVLGLVWLGGLAWALQDHFNTSGGMPVKKAPAAVAEPPAPETKDGSFRVVALGDSLTSGVGDTAQKGYVGYLADRLKEKKGQDIAVDNLGVSGQTSAQLAASLGESRVRSRLKGADVVLISIGGNDLFQGGETLKALDAVKIQGIEEAFMRQLDTILKQIKEENANARIFLIGLYNPFIDLKDSEATSTIVREWNFKAAETASRYPLTVWVPTYDLFQLKVQDYLARDLFHPNSAGYRLIGERVASLITG